MTSKVIDLATIVYGLHRFGETHVKDMRLVPHPDVPDQVAFAEWYNANFGEVLWLQGLLAETSADYQVLNRFSTDHGHVPMFSAPFDGVGIVSIADLLVNWVKPGTITTIDVVLDHGHLYDAFEISVYAYNTVPGQRHPLIQIPTHEGDTVWLLPLDNEPTSSLGLFTTMATAIQNNQRNHVGPKLRAPMVDLRADADLEWLLGFGAVGSELDSDWHVAQAKQTVQVRMNHIGASARVDTAMVMERSLVIAEEPYVIDRPFALCLTQGVSNVPLPVAYVDFDSWKAPESLAFADGE